MVLVKLELLLHDLVSLPVGGFVMVLEVGLGSPVEVVLRGPQNILTLRLQLILGQALSSSCLVLLGLLC